MSYLVSEDLRHYASTKEAEIRDRIDAFRKQKEDELKRKVGRRIIENELKQLVLKRMREGRSDITKILDEQFEYLLNRLATKWGSTDVFGGKDTPDMEVENEAAVVKAKFEKFVDESRFECELALKNKAEQIKNILSEVREPHDFSEVTSEKHKEVVATISEVKAQIAKREVQRSKLHAELATAARSELETTYKQKIHAMIHAINADVRQFHAVMAELANSDIPHGDVDAVASYRRRLLLAIEKRIYDLTKYFEVAKRETIRRITQEYRLEVVKLFLRYVEVTAGRLGEGAACTFNDTPFIKAAWEKNNIGIKDRVKFIQLVFEKVRSHELMCYVHEALMRESSFISQ